mgnify:CR=1 FL=1
MTQNRLTRRSFLKFAGGTVAIGALAACVPAAPAPAGEAGGEAPATDPGTLWALQKQDFHPEYNDFIRAHIVNYAAENDLTLDVAYTAGFAGTGADNQKVAAAVQAGDPPDVWMDNRNPFQLQQLGTLQPVTDLQEEVIAIYGEPNPRPKSETLLEGEYVGVTLHTRSDGGWARTDVFEPAGIDLAAIITYDELAAAAMEVSDPDNELWGWGMTVNRGGDGGWFIQRVLHGWGATWVDETGDYVTIDSPEAVEAVEWLVDLYTNPEWEKMMPPGVLSWTDSSNNEAYLGGKVAYTQNAGSVYAKAVADGLDVANHTMFDIPKGGPALQDFNGLGGMYLHHIMGSKNPEHARGLIMSFFNDEVQQGMFGSGWNGLPWPGPSTAQIGAVGSSNVHTDMIANVLNGQMTAAESVKNAYDQSVTIFKEFGAPGEA